MTDTLTVQDMALIRQKVKAIESAMLWTSGLLNMMVLDICKAYCQTPCEPVKTCIQESQKRHGFVAFGDGRRCKAHETLTNPNIEGDRKCPRMTKANPLNGHKNSCLKGHGYEIHTPGVDSAGILRGQD